MRISDWSSDVCSSDLAEILAARQRIHLGQARRAEMLPHGAHGFRHRRLVVDGERETADLADLRHLRCARRRRLGLDDALDGVEHTTPPGFLEGADVQPQQGYVGASVPVEAPPYGTREKA